MNKQISDILTIAIQDNLRVLDVAHQLYEAGYEHGKQETPKGLPGVTAAQVRKLFGKLANECTEEGFSLPQALADWFNDPNRDAPVKPTMHPDLEWLANVPPERFVVPKISQHCGGTPYFFKRTERCAHKGAAWVKTSTIGWGTRPELRPAHAWDLSEIEQARKHLAKPKCDVQWSTEPLPNGNVRITGTAVSREADPSLDLNNLPDYRLWFDIHGSERTVKYEASGEQEASVHGIYNNFRARLLDELRQAGVVGDEQ